MSDRRSAAALFVLTLVTYAWFFNGAGWNANAQFDLVRSLVEHRTFAIDRYHQNTGDVSFAGGHVYSNKPPGASLLGVVPYAVLYLIERAAGLDVDSAPVLIVNLWLVTLIVCGISGALISPVLFLYARRAGADRGAALGVSIAIGFGTLVFPYATVYFAHVPAALFLLLALVWLDDRPMAAGVAAGAAGLCYYLAIPVAAVLAVAAAVRSRPAALKFVLGGLPFGAGLLWYQFTLFGSPFFSAVQASSRFTDRAALLGVFLWPRADVLWAITFSKYRGLFYLSPILLVSFVGAAVMVRRRIMLRELCVVGATLVVFLFLNMSFNGWHGGSAIGPRYLLPAVPLLALPMLYGWRYLRPARVALLIWSVAISLLVTAVNPLPSRFIEDPIGSYIVPLFVTGRLSASVPPQPLFSWKVMLGHVSVNAHAPDERHPFTRHRPGSRIARWASFNLGETVAENSVLSVLPIGIWILAGSLWLSRKTGAG